MINYLLLIVALITIAFTSLVSVPGSSYLINGTTQADISNMFPSLVTPAGVTFAIWSLIYLSWIIAGVYLAFFDKNHTWKKYRKSIIIFALAIGLTGVWLIPWGNLYIGLALIVMLIILWLLKYAFHHTRWSNIVLRSTVELTLGWINIATVANITIYLISIGFTGGPIPELYWAIWVLGLALLLTAYYQCRYRAYIISLVFIWTMLWEWIAHPAIEQRVAVALFATVAVINMIISYSKSK